MIKKIILRMLYTVLIVLGALVTITLLFINLSPEMGGKPSLEDKEKYEATGRYKEGKFANQIPTSMDMGFKQTMETIVEFIKGVPNSKPGFNIPVNTVDSLYLEESIQEPKLIWFGHSAFLLQLGGKNILLDPMFGDVPAPHPVLGSKRYSDSLPIEIEQLPQIDAIVISHDHYDHLDYGSIKKLKDKTKFFIVPLGVGAHFKSWGVDEKQIQELNWWEETTLDDLKLVFTPSRHFSGRGFSDRFSTLWGSWIIQSNDKNIFFSGDGGYGEHFKEIGQKYGPFDFAMMECGQYNEKWADIHMTPEESAQAGVDIQAKMVMPIHWGAFTLALHSWTDPVERILKKAQELELPIQVPEIGAVINLDKIEKYQKTEWWNVN